MINTKLAYLSVATLRKPILAIVGIFTKFVGDIGIILTLVQRLISLHSDVRLILEPFKISKFPEFNLLMIHKLFSDQLFLHWITFTDDRERLIRQYGRFRPSFIHRDELPHIGDGVATPRRNYNHYERQPSRVSKDRSKYAAQNYKGDYNLVATLRSDS